MPDPTGPQDLGRERRGVLFGIAAALAVIAAAAFAVWRWSGAFVLDADLEGRLRLGAVAALAPAMVVAVQVGWIARRRFFSPEMIGGAAFDGGASAVDRAVLANSVEQAVVAVPAYLFLALTLPAERLVALPLLAALFLVGRAAFVARYRHGAAARSFGFALTFYSTVLGTAAGAASLVFA